MNVMFCGTPAERVELGNGMPLFVGFTIAFGNKDVVFEDMNQSLDFKIEGTFDTQYVKDIGAKLKLDQETQTLYVTGELIKAIDEKSERETLYYVFSEDEKLKLLNFNKKDL